MTDNEKQFEDFVREIKFDDTPDPNHRDKLEQNLLRALAKQTPRQIKIWRTIMKTKITKLATAAAIIFAVVLLVSILNNSTTPAYAIEDTIEAMREIRTVHIFGTDVNDKQYEIWTKVNPETGKAECLYLDASETEHRLILVSTPQEGSYSYDINTNTVEHWKEQGLTEKIRFGRFFEDVIENIVKPKNGSIQTSREYDPQREKEVIVVLVEADELKLKWIIDPETNLPLSSEYLAGFQRRPGHHIGKTMDEIYYNEPLPDGIFEFEIPEGATVIEK